MLRYIQVKITESQPRFTPGNSQNTSEKYYCLNQLAGGKSFPSKPLETGQGQMAGTCEYSDELSGSMK